MIFSTFNEMSLKDLFGCVRTTRVSRHRVGGSSQWRPLFAVVLLRTIAGSEASKDFSIHYRNGMIQGTESQRRKNGRKAISNSGDEMMIHESSKRGDTFKRSIMPCYWRITRTTPVTVLVLVFGGAILMWSCLLTFEQLPRTAILRPYQHFVNDTTLGCESPSLPIGSIHIVVASYLYNQMDAGIGFEKEHNYLWDLRLSNADIYWYRRVQPHQPLRRQLNGPCGMMLQERLLLPNYGREGASFVDHVLEVYHNPPKSIIFLHGHAAVGWHTSCESVFSRSTYFYRQVVKESNHESRRRNILNNHNKTVQNHMMTLTSSIYGTKDFDAFKWYGINETNAPNVPPEVVAADESGQVQQSPCWKLKQRWKNALAPFTNTMPSFMSCCASFILPGKRIQRFPRAFYQDLLSALMDESQPDQGRECFEYVAYQWFADEPEQFTREDIQQFYKNADGLIHGHNQDQDVLNRMERCKASAKDTIESYTKKQKWKVQNNKWRRFDGHDAGGKSTD